MALTCGGEPPSGVLHLLFCSNKPKRCRFIKNAVNVSSQPTSTSKLNLCCQFTVKWQAAKGNKCLVKLKCSSNRWQGKVKQVFKPRFYFDVAKLLLMCWREVNSLSKLIMITLHTNRAETPFHFPPVIFLKYVYTDYTVSTNNLKCFNHVYQVNMLHGLCNLVEVSVHFSIY